MVGLHWVVFFIIQNPADSHRGVTGGTNRSDPNWIGAHRPNNKIGDISEIFHTLIVPRNR